MDDFGIGQHAFDQADKQKVGRQFIGDQFGIWCQLFQPVQIVLTHFAQPSVINLFGKCHRRLAAPRRRNNCRQGQKLARPMHLRMVAQNLLHQCGARPGHAQNKNRRWIRRPRRAMFFKEFRVKHVH